MAQFTSDNHYVPRHYLRAWSDDGAKVQAYPLLVPKASAPLWKPRSISALAVHAHLYTSALGGNESDAFERWMHTEVEQPAEVAIDKVRTGRRMTREDWRRLAYYVAALDRRTPAAYLEHMRFMDRHGPEMLERTLSRVKAGLEAGRHLESVASAGSAGDGAALDPEALPLRVWKGPADEPGMAALHVELSIGRETWIQGIRRAVTSTARVLTQHRWVVLNPPRGTEWFTSDHPVLRLNYYKPGSYDFGGGWGNPGSEIMLPLSPEHLLYTKVGDRRFKHGRADGEVAQHVRRFLAERAHRWIFARAEQADLPALRPRTADLAQYISERDEWAAWHQRNSEAEHRRLAAIHAAQGLEA